MASYGLADRFCPVPDCRRVGNLDPGACNLMPFIRRPKANKVPFLSRVPRKTFLGARMYTQVLYDAEKPRHIMGGCALQSKSPRFKDDRSLHPQQETEHRCRCELDPCECPVDEEQTGVELCQAKIPRKLYKGHVPFSWLGTSKSMPSRAHQGYQVFPDGTRRLIPPPSTDTTLGPAFYNACTVDATSFYHGCKWSNWTGKRESVGPAATPGPADYQHEHVPTLYALCMEEFKFDRRHHSKQLRYIEMLQMKSLLHGNPGPSDYDPKLPTYDYVEHPWDKAPRFPEPTLEKRPGPAEYNIAGPSPDYKAKSNVMKAAAAPFGVRGERFRWKPDGLPGPGQYSPCIKSTPKSSCCPPPFGSSAPRMKADHHESESEEETPAVCCPCPPNMCVVPTSSFKSKSIRFKPLVKRLDDPSPADMPLPMTKLRKRQPHVQRLSPFQSSEGRFQPWHDWMPVLGAEVTPGPGVYDLTCKPYCIGGGWTQACAPRFPQREHSGPPPNAYYVDRGIETVRHTFNKRLLKNVNKKDLFKWTPPLKSAKSVRSREKHLIAKSIQQLDPDYDTTKEKKLPKRKRPTKDQGDKKHRVPGEKLLLNDFLYDHQFPTY